MAGAAPRPPLHSTWPHFNCRALGPAAHSSPHRERPPRAHVPYTISSSTSSTCPVESQPQRPRRRLNRPHAPCAARPRPHNTPRRRGSTRRRGTRNEEGGRACGRGGGVRRGGGRRRRGGERGERTSLISQVTSSYPFFGLIYSNQRELVWIVNTRFLA